ncbi:YqhG family protein [Thalassobacillus hwangdonensis]|uniref:YqhG family protein n=1 Tax=Thalassobacillus hwangdonensis TaxID=546108 RepID=A0ABW3KXV8_9BACI
MKNAAEHHQFILDFFDEYQCPIIENNNGKVVVQLTDRMDEAIMNRPFYWHYIKKMGRAGDPWSLTLITNPDLTEDKGEYIHSGAPRLRQLYQHLFDTCRFTKQYELLHVNNTQVALVPWLVINVRVSYSGNRRKSEVHSYGLNLVHGTLLEQMMDSLHGVELATSISDFTYPLSPLIKTPSGYNRIIQYIEDHVQSKDHGWAEETNKKRDHEMNLIEAFFQDTEDEERHQLMKKEKEDLLARLTPTITIETINGGLIYLSPSTSQQMSLT